MKKRLKQILSALLVAVMLIGIAPMGDISFKVKAISENGNDVVFNSKLCRLNGNYYLIDKTSVYKYNSNLTQKKELLFHADGFSKMCVYKDTLYFLNGDSTGIAVYDEETENIKTLYNSKNPYHSDVSLFFYKDYAIFSDYAVESEDLSNNHIYIYDIKFKKLLSDFDGRIIKVIDSKIFYEIKFEDSSLICFLCFDLETDTQSILYADSYSESPYYEENIYSVNITDVAYYNKSVYFVLGYTAGTGRYFYGALYRYDLNNTFSIIKKGVGRSLYYSNDTLFGTMQYDGYRGEQGVYYVEGGSTQIYDDSIYNILNFDADSIINYNDKGLYIYDLKTKKNSLVCNTADYLNKYDQVIEEYINNWTGYSKPPKKYFSVNYYKSFISSNVLVYSPVVCIPKGEIDNSYHTVYECDYEIKNYNPAILTFADDPALCVEDGKSINLRFALTKDGGESLYDGWSQPALTVGDKTVISVSNMTEKDSVYSVTVKGLKIGQSTLVVTDPQTGTSTSLLIKVKDKYAKTYTYAIDKMKEFYPDNKYEKDIKTNIYNQHGIYVNNYSAKYDQKKDAYTVSFKAFNSQYLSGAVDIFDKNGNWIGSEEIKHRSSISSLKDTAIKGFYLIADWGTGKLITYEQNSFSEESDISFEVPNGGHFTISNNYAQSFGTFLYNSTEILLNGINAAIGGVKAEKELDPAELVKEAIEKDETIKEEMNELIKKTLSKIVEKQFDNFIDMSIEQGCESISNALLNVFIALDIDYNDAISVALGVSESKLLKAFGPAGDALKGCFTIAKTTDMITQFNEIVKSINAEYTTVVTSLDNGYVNDNGISVITNGNIDKEAVLQTFCVSASDVVEAFLDPQNPYEQYELYNICFVKDDQYVQPNGKVTVEIPAPENMKGDSCKVYRQEKDGKWTVLQAYRKGDYIYFETDHFSMYALVYEKNEPEIVKLPNKLNYTVGQAIDLSGMVLKLNGKEITSGFMSKDNLAYKAGKQTVTVLYGDSEVTFDINVKEPQVKSVSVSDITLNYKKSTTLKPTIKADDGAKYKVEYSTSNAKIATVDKNGKVTATKRGSGTATITCTVTDSNGNVVKDTCKVNVKLSFGQILIVYVLFGWIWY